MYVGQLEWKGLVRDGPHCTIHPEIDGIAASVLFVWHFPLAFDLIVDEI